MGGEAFIRLERIRRLNESDFGLDPEEALTASQWLLAHTNWLDEQIARNECEAQVEGLQKVVIEYRK